mmetsp:Transcript_29556/g.88378  ORF Transcript_29556/g.88378 Transcript_29556/m.88378 type:complete len:253 (-) Transcript_29556:81-839(-)
MVNNRLERVPLALDVVPVAPEVAAGRYHVVIRLRGLVVAPVRRPRARVDNVAAGGLECRAHLRISGRVSRDVVVAAVELEVVHTPVGERLRVELLVALRAGVAAAGLRALVGVDAEFHALGVHVVREVLGPGGKAAGVHGEGRARRARPRVRLPAVVDGHRGVARREVALVRERVRLRAVERLVHAAVWVEVAVDGAAEDLPGHPAHGRRLRELFCIGARGEGGKESFGHDALGWLLGALAVLFVRIKDACR